MKFRGGAICKASRSWISASSHDAQISRQLVLHSPHRSLYEVSTGDGSVQSLLLTTRGIEALRVGGVARYDASA